MGQARGGQVMGRYFKVYLLNFTTKYMYNNFRVQQLFAPSKTNILIAGGQGGTHQRGTKTKKDNQKCGSSTTMLTYPHGQYINRIFSHF